MFAVVERIAGGEETEAQKADKHSKERRARAALQRGLLARNGRDSSVFSCTLLIGQSDFMMKIIYCDYFALYHLNHLVTIT